MGGERLSMVPTGAVRVESFASEQSVSAPVMNLRPFAQRSNTLVSLQRELILSG